MSNGNGSLFTPTQRRIIDLLKDGKPHKRDDVRKAVDELASYDTLQVHLTHLREKVRPHGYDIICQVLNRNFHYRIIRVAVLQWPAGPV